LGNSEKGRRAAALALKETKSETAVKILTDALKDEDFEVPMYAEKALKKIDRSVAK